MISKMAQSHGKQQTFNQMRLKTIALHWIIQLIFKLAGEQFDMSRFPSGDAGPWEKLHHHSSSLKYSYGCKTYLSPFSGGLQQQGTQLNWCIKHQTRWKFMMKTGSGQRFPNTTTASNAIEAARIPMRSRPGGVKLVQSVVWDLI